MPTNRLRFDVFDVLWIIHALIPGLMDTSSWDNVFRSSWFNGGCTFCYSLVVIFTQICIMCLLVSRFETNVIFTRKKNKKKIFTKLQMVGYILRFRFLVKQLGALLLLSTTCLQLQMIKGAFICVACSDLLLMGRVYITWAVREIIVRLCLQSHIVCYIWALVL